MTAEFYTIVLGITFPFICFLCIRFYGNNKLSFSKCKSSSIKNEEHLHKEKEYLKTHKRKISPEAAKIYNEQLAIYKSNIEKNGVIDLEIRWFEEAIKNCDMQKATMYCKDLWSHDARLVLNEYLMNKLFEIHDCYE